MCYDSNGMKYPELSYVFTGTKKQIRTPLEVILLSPEKKALSRAIKSLSHCAPSEYLLQALQTNRIGAGFFIEWLPPEWEMLIFSRNMTTRMENAYF